MDILPLCALAHMEANPDFCANDELKDFVGLTPVETAVGDKQTQMGLCRTL